MPGTAAAGVTRAELIENLRGVLIIHMHAMERDGDHIPAPSFDAEPIAVSEEEVRSFTSDPLPNSTATA